MVRVPWVRVPEAHLEQEAVQAVVVGPMLEDTGKLPTPLVKAFQLPTQVWLLRCAGLPKLARWVDLGDLATREVQTEPPILAMAEVAALIGGELHYRPSAPRADLD